MSFAPDRTLAKPPRRLNRRRAEELGLVLMTDTARLADPSATIRQMPPGSAVIVRHTDAQERARLARRLLRLCRRRGVRLVIADDARLARRLAADGLHLPEARLRAMRAVEPPPDGWLTAAAHGAAALALAARRGIDIVLLSSVRPTASHPGRRPLGPSGFRRLARRPGPAVYALGGVGPRDARWVRAAGGKGIAGIGALTTASRRALRRAQRSFSAG